MYDYAFRHIKGELSLVYATVLINLKTSYMKFKQNNETNTFSSLLYWLPLGYLLVTFITT